MAEKIYLQTGQLFGRLTVIEEAQPVVVGNRNRSAWLCSCECGQQVVVQTLNLRNGGTKSCGCLRRDMTSANFKDLSGRRFGKLRVTEEWEPGSYGRAVWTCTCDCGNTKKVQSALLLRGKTQSCGCLYRVDPNRKEKICSKCKELLPIEDFGIRSVSPDGRNCTCTPCDRKRRDLLLLRRFGGDKHAEMLHHTYGMGKEQYNRMAQAQNYSCLICKRQGELHVDHDHPTGKVRGLLCGKCNRGLGHFDDKPELLETAATYLRDWQ